GVHYDLQVSVQGHAVAGFVFAPAPVLEDENGNNTTPQNVDDATNWYTFFNNQIGDGSLCAPNCGAVINSQTPYAQILGSGNGTFDLYSFTVTDAMLNPQSSTIGTGSVTALGPFYTSVGLVLTGNVRAGDAWKLGINNQIIRYDAMTGNDLQAVANNIASQLGSPYTTSVTNVAGVVTLTISNPNGFSLNGVSLTGLAQIGSPNDRITRTTTATQADGQTLVTFTSADVTFDCGGASCDPEAGDT